MKFPQLLQLLEPDVLLTSLSVSNLKILLKNAGTEIEEIFDKEEVGKAAKYVRAYRGNFILNCSCWLLAKPGQTGCVAIGVNKSICKARLI